MSEYGMFEVRQEEWSDGERQGWTCWCPTEGRFMVRWSDDALAPRHHVVFVDSPYAARDMLIDLGFEYDRSRGRVSSWCGPDGFSARLSDDSRVAWFTVESGK